MESKQKSVPRIAKISNFPRFKLSSHEHKHLSRKVQKSQKFLKVLKKARNVSSRLLVSKLKEMKRMKNIDDVVSIKGIQTKKDLKTMELTEIVTQTAFQKIQPKISTSELLNKLLKEDDDKDILSPLLSKSISKRKKGPNKRRLSSFV